MDFGYTKEYMTSTERIIKFKKSPQFYTNEDDKEARQLIADLKNEYEQKNREARRLVEFIRPEILEFAEAMELTMRKHDGKKGDSWKTCDIYFLIEKLKEEFDEADCAFDNLVHHDFEDEGQFTAETVDLANVCMMLWNRNEGE